MVVNPILTKTYTILTVLGVLYAYSIQNSHTFRDCFEVYENKAV